jgi:formylglycine-generating enzyme required for sulfatase activity
MKMKLLLKMQAAFSAAIVGILVLAGCSDPVSLVQEKGKGTVNILIGNDTNSRTLFPQTPQFSRYELRFTPNGGQAAKNPETVTSTNTTVTLVTGSWTITALAYINVGSNEYEVARGSKNLTVNTGSNNVIIDIKGNVEEGTGTFSYELTYPDDVSAAVLKALSLTGELKKEVNLKADGSSGSFTLNAGYYLLRVELEKDEGKAVKTEVIHIYKNLTTRAYGDEYGFTGNDFLITIDTDAVVTPGTMTIYYTDGVSFNMAAVPGRIPFPTGIYDSGRAVVTYPYQMAETEVTWELWNTVRTWAVENGYSMSAGRRGSGGSGSDQQPVTMVNWYDSIVWCNALIEYWNEKTGANLATVYNSEGSPVRDANNTWTLDNVTPSVTARGFRLPTSNEWELAARWRNDDANTVAGYSNPWFTKGDSASGATANVYDSAATGNVAVYNSNSGNSTAIVKSKAPNALGLYDMSGNVWDFCIDVLQDNAHVNRGGTYQNDYSYIRIGYVFSRSQYQMFEDVGFRIARTGYKADEVVPPSNVNVPIQITFAGPDDVNITVDYAIDITTDPYYDPALPVLQDNVWYDDSNPVKRYQFYAQSGVSYAVAWNDSYQGNGTKSADIGVSAYWKDTNGSIFGRTDSGWDIPQSFTANRSGIVVLQVEHYTSGNTTGTYALRHYRTSSSSSSSSITKADTLNLSAPAGYAGYKWIFGNVNMGSGNTISLGPDLTLGPHSVTLIIYRQEGSVQVPYSKTLAFNVVP